MIPKLANLAAIGCLLLTLCSCKEDPELVRKREEQQSEIKRLQGELQIIQEKLKDIPPDKTKELIVAKGEADAQALEIERLEKEVAALEVKKKEIEGKFSDYKKKYPLKN
jgi:hypothetical protein